MAHPLCRIDVGDVGDACKEGEDWAGKGGEKSREGRGGTNDSLSTMETMPHRFPLPTLEREGEEERKASLSVTKSR